MSTPTGRAESKPAMQNILIRTVEGKLIREAFDAAKPPMPEIDFGPTELRILAWAAGKTGAGE